VNTHSVAKHYDTLTPEERFALLVAAQARGDQAEYRRLQDAAPRVAVSEQTHQPITLAFLEISWAKFVQLSDLAANILTAFITWRSTAKKDEDDPLIHNALALGYSLKTHTAAWVMFCERHRLAPFVFWQKLPGFVRLEMMLGIVEGALFSPEGYLRWVNNRRPPGAPEKTQVDLTAESAARELESWFQERVAWWTPT